MATLTIRGIYEDGTLRPLQPLPLQEHECVLVQVLRQCTVAETSGLLPGLPLTIIREVAAGEEYSVLSSRLSSPPSRRHLFIDANMLRENICGLPLTRGHYDG